MVSAAETAARVRAGETTAVAEVTAALARLEAAGDLGALVRVLRTEALEAAAKVDAAPGGLPLAGVPVLIKDNVPVAGQPTGIGSRATSPAVATEDAPLVARLRAAGAVVVGLTTVPELCIFGATDGEGYVARNPWNPARTPGGSSGGSAAAVAAGLVALAHGNDGMGSIRIPSACCGLVGIKPGRGVVPHGQADDWRGLSENGPLATTVADAALGLSVMADDPSLAVVTEPAGVRIAVSSNRPVAGVPLAREWRDGLTVASGALAGQAHLLRSVKVPYPLWLGPTLIATWTAAVADTTDGLERSRLQKRSRRHAAAGRVLDRTGLASPVRHARWQAVAERFFTSFDVLMTPSLAQAPVAASRWSERGWLVNLQASTRYAPFAAPWNLLGWPALSVPVPGRSSAGTPLGVQLVGKPGSEGLLLGLAAQLERLRPWDPIAPSML